MAKRITRKSSASSSTPISMPGARPEAPAEPTIKTTERTTSSAGRHQDVRSAAEMVAVTHEMIAQRAYDIWRSEGGNDTENWLKAERELQARNEQGQWQ